MSIARKIVYWVRRKNWQSHGKRLAANGETKQEGKNEESFRLGKLETMADRVGLISSIDDTVQLQPADRQSKNNYYETITSLHTRRHGRLRL